MTDYDKNANVTPVTTNVYVGVQVGAYRDTKGSTTTPNVGILLGGEISKNGTFAKAEVGAGTSSYADIKAGHEFDIGSNMGLELSGNLSYVRNNYESSKQTSIIINGKPALDNKVEWHEGYKKAAAGLAFNFKGKKGNVKVGMEAGYRSDLGFNQLVNGNINMNINAPSLGDIKENLDNINSIEGKYTAFKQTAKSEAAFYATPTVSAELNLGKSGHWSVTANANLYDGKAGIKYTF